MTRPDRRLPSSSWLGGRVHDEQVSEGVRAGTCAALSDALDEPLAATAAVATTWLCLEQPGPWGREALTGSHLDPDLGAELARRTDAAGVRAQLIRRPGRHPDTGESGPRRVYLAHTRPGLGWLRDLALDDPADLLDLDFEGLAEGRHEGVGTATEDPILLVCTNGRRDRCCALWGRTLLDELQGRHAGSIWETTHTGGHRFAPAGVLLPSGYTYGRMTAGDAEAALSAAASGKLVTHSCRGRSTWSRAGQAAELAVREEIGEYLTDALEVEHSDAGTVVVAHRDGRRWAVSVEERELDPARPNSCGKADVHPTAWTVGDVRRL